MTHPTPAQEGKDPFGTARRRRTVLDSWAASPARFREDANAEEDLVLGGYRDRLVVELAQNAADAAARAGTDGRLRLTLHESAGIHVLAAANTGTPLDATGVESLSTLRASAKRPATEAAPGAGPGIGRFGVGFAAVLAVSDEPAVLSRTGGVRWDLAQAREAAREVARHSPGLGDELIRRDGHVPLLRLPFPAEGTPPEGYDTVVVLPLRDTAAQDLAERLLAGVDDALLLALPGLTEIVVETPEATRVLRRRDEEPYVVIEESAGDAGAAGDPAETRRWRTAT
ncbi:sacsin N-terminal ATP-binding-like domain-containing protein, partial [Streptomyces sp. ZG43]